MEIEITNRIVWHEENTEKFGLDYTTLKGEFVFFEFDIRYDYDGKPTEKPDSCGLNCCIYFKGKKVENKISTDINYLKKYCEFYIKKIQDTFLKANLV